MTNDEMKKRLEEEFGGKWEYVDYHYFGKDELNSEKSNTIRKCVGNIEVSFLQFFNKGNKQPYAVRFEVEVDGKLITTYVEKCYHSFSKCLRGFNTFMESFEKNLNAEKQKVSQSVLNFYQAKKKSSIKKKNSKEINTIGY